jgi:hypothetical protein
MAFSDNKPPFQQYGRYYLALKIIVVALAAWLALKLIGVL